MRQHLSYANVTATLALLLAVAGGTAYAVDRITSRDIANNSVKSVDLRNQHGVRGKDVKPNSLTGRQINEATIHPSPFAGLAGNETGTECVLKVQAQNCVIATIKLDQRADLLVMATGNQESLGGPGQASCRVRIDGVDEPLAVDPGEVRDNTAITATNGFARTLMSADPLGAGPHVVALSCKRLQGSTRINEPTIAAIAIAHP